MKSLNTHNSKLNFFIFIVILINFGIVFYIYINKKEQKDKVGDKQIKNDFFQNDIKIKMINFEAKINLLENKINNLKSKDNEDNIYNSKIKNEENNNN